jgi:hypothetical protein
MHEMSPYSFILATAAKDADVIEQLRQDCAGGAQRVIVNESFQ